jgi:hypothetical protein
MELKSVGKQKGNYLMGKLINRKGFKTGAAYTKPDV